MSKPGKNKKILLHDLPEGMSQQLLRNLPKEFVVLNANEKAASCIGCFKCWLKKPGICTFPDRLEYAGQTLLASEQLVIISRLLYGGLSVPVKKIIDRAIPGITPFFKVRNGQLHHLERYKTQTSLKIIFYDTGDAGEEEKKQGIQYASAMGVNYLSRHTETIFLEDSDFSEVAI